jgi:hypothetical protein
VAVDRRELLTGAALGTLVLPWAMSGVAAQSGGAPAPAGVDARQLFHKLHFRTDDGVIFWWLMGPKIGQVGTTLTPLYTSCVGTVQRLMHHADGSFDVTHLEMIVMLDLETGAPLEQWRNPYTGETVPARHNIVGPVTSRYRPDGSRVLPTEIGGTPLEASARTAAPIIVGDDVFIRDESVARVFTPGRKTPFEVNDIAVYHGSLQNLVDPAVKVGDATVFFAEVTSWQRWMKMDDAPGSLTSRLTGRKVRRFEDLPEVFRRKLAQMSPEIAADPIAALDRPAPKFDR